MAKKLTKFGDRFEYLMERHGLSKMQLEKKAGLYNGQAGIFISGKTEPGLKTLQKLIKTFKGVNVGWLLTGEGKPGV